MTENLTQPNPISNLAAALAKAQGLIPPPLKKRVVDFTNNKGQRVRYNYADLSDVIDCIKKPLSDNGLAITHRMVFDDSGFGMITRLMHESGESIETYYPLPDPSSELKPQEFASYQTYARRYSLTALLGVASEEDDDGQEAPAPKPPQTNRKPVLNGPKITPQALTPKPVPTPLKADQDDIQDPPSKSELLKLFNTAMEHGWAQTQIGEYMIQKYKVDSSKFLNRGQFGEFMEAVTKHTFEEAMDKLN